MNLLSIIESLRRNLKTVIYGCIAVLVLVVAADFVRALSAHGAEAAATTEGHGTAAAEHVASGFWASAYHLAENVPVFWTVFGFLGCVLLVIVSKAVVGPFVSKEEDFYNE